MQLGYICALLYDLSLCELGITNRKERIMAYTAMRKLIENENNKLENNTITQEVYDLWKESAQNKLDIFLACNRITSEQYEELTGMLK
jgi:hypothetical protein